MQSKLQLLTDKLFCHIFYYEILRNNNQADAPFQKHRPD